MTMKTLHIPLVLGRISIALLGALAWFVALPLAHSAPPELMTYQGFLVDADGNPLATNNPANYPIAFRIYSAATGGTRLWSEQQIVTVDKGNFSVLLGEGTPVSAELRPALSAVFSGANNADRYISLSVTIGANTSEMLPRLRLLPAPYAFTATSASYLAQPNGTPALSYANNRIEVVGELFTAGNLNVSGGLSLGGILNVPTLNVSGAASVNGQLQAGNLTVLAQDTVNEGGEILLRGAGANPDWRIDNASGQVRVFSGGAAAAVVGPSQLQVIGGLLARGGPPGAAGVNHNGYAFSGNGGDTDSGLFSSGDGQLEFHGNSIERMRLTADGNWGIGTPAPAARLDVRGGTERLGAPALVVGAPSGSQGQRAIAGLWSTFANAPADTTARRTADIVAGFNGAAWGSEYLALHVGNNTAANDAAALTSEKLRITGDGKVGIGTSLPTATLSVNGTVSIGSTNTLEFGGGVAGKELNAGKIGYQTFSPNALDIVGAGTNGSNRRVNFFAEGGTTFNGRIGVGTSTPRVPLDVVGSVNFTLNDVQNNSIDVLDGFGHNGAAGSSVTTSFSILAQQRIGAVGYVATSDRRIKKEITTSATGKDLAAIQQLRVAEYRMVDRISHGTGRRKGFIAQEVEKVVPEAVSQSVNFIPDIFALATNASYTASTKTLIVSLSKAHELKAGERVRLQIDNDLVDVDVARVTSAHEFTVEKCERAPERVFVYGRQVNDFRTVDYDHIFTVGVGAIQELGRKVQELESAQSQLADLAKRAARADALEKENTGLRAKLELQDARLAALEKLVQQKLNGAQQAGYRAANTSRLD